MASSQSTNSDDSTTEAVPASFEEAVKLYAEKMIKGRGLDSIPYNWLPFCTAIAMGLTNLNEPFGPVNPAATTDDDETKTGVVGRHGDTSLHRGHPKLTPPKKSATESWDHTWYVPEWTHPDWDGSIRKSYNGEAFLVTNSDAYANARPALRPEDVIRHPTPYAIRYGIHPDELGGRSRLSPTLSQTRDPWQDYANQINMLDEDLKQKCIEETKMLWQSTGAANVDGSRNIDPSVLEKVLHANVGQSNAEWAEQLKAILGNRQWNLEKYVNYLENKAPLTKMAHQGLLQNALEDQDYQRLIFRGLTTDEMIETGAHVMSEDANCDLQNGIHPLFARNRWELSSWKGAQKIFPRFLCGLNGIREEWDVATNDRIWEALQPALKLVSRVIASEHPYVRALLNLATRQPIDHSRDPRDNPQTAELTKFVLEKDIDWGKAYPELVSLQRRGFNWPRETWIFLDKTFRIDIMSGFLSPGSNLADSDDEDPEESDEFSYGQMRAYEAGPDTSQIVYLSAELIWPLLMDRFSKSEKMVASFQIATTLLHEFMHAISRAHNLICSEPNVHLAHHPQEIQNLCSYLNDKLWAFDLGNGEPFFQDMPQVEVGHQFENELWGFNCNNATADGQSSSKYLVSLPLAVVGDAFPECRPPGTYHSSSLKGAHFPVEDYGTPIPVDFIAQFFTERFWIANFQAYGFEALKQLPMDRVHKKVLRTFYCRLSEGNNVFGSANWKFIKNIFVLLKSFHYPILGMYIEALAFDAARVRFLWKRWFYEALVWKDDTVAPLAKKVDELFKSVIAVDQLHALRNSQTNLERCTLLYNEYYRRTLANYHAQVSPSMPLSMADWCSKVTERWNEAFRVGGYIMAQLSEVHRLMQDDLGFLQNMIFDFLMIDNQERANLSAGNGPSGASPIMVAHQRMVYFRQRALDISNFVMQVTSLPALAPIKNHWEAYRARFAANARMYVELLEMLRVERSIHSSHMFWKDRFAKLPTSVWKSRVDRMRAMATKEYKRAHPDVRKTVDDCLQIISQVTGSIEKPQPVQAEELAQLMTGVNNAMGFDPNRPPKPTIFDFSAPLNPGTSTGTVDQIPLPAAAVSSPAPSGLPSRVKFGVPGGNLGSGARALGGSEARRTNQDPPSSSTLSSQNIQNTVGGGEATGFARFAGDNHALSTLGTVAQQSTQAGNIFGIGGPLTTASAQQSAFHARTTLSSSNLPAQPFPNAWSTAATMTADIVAYQEQLRLQQQSQTSTGDAYQAPRIWREAGVGGRSFDNTAFWDGDSDGE